MIMDRQTLLDRRVILIWSFVATALIIQGVVLGIAYMINGMGADSSNIIASTMATLVVGTAFFLRPLRDNAKLLKYAVYES